MTQQEIIYLNLKTYRTIIFDCILYHVFHPVVVATRFLENQLSKNTNIHVGNELIYIHTRYLQHIVNHGGHLIFHLYFRFSY